MKKQEDERMKRVKKIFFFVLISFMSHFGHVYGETIPKPIFYLPLDGNTSAIIANGNPLAKRLAGLSDVILNVVSKSKDSFKKGVVGQSYGIRDRALVYSCKGNFNPVEGTFVSWVCPQFKGSNKGTYNSFFGAEKWGMFYKYLRNTNLQFAVARTSGEFNYDCGSNDISSWEPGQWHHLAISWSTKLNKRKIYIDGVLQFPTGSFSKIRNFDDGSLFIGSSCEKYPGHLANSNMDEVAIWDQALNDKTIKAIYEAGKNGQALFGSSAQQKVNQDTVRKITVPVIKSPDNQKDQEPKVEMVNTSKTINLSGWWNILPQAKVLTSLPSKGWGWAKLPGFNAAFVKKDENVIIDPSGSFSTKNWQGKKLSEFALFYFNKTFNIPANWEGGNIFLSMGGVEGLAEIYCNGKYVDTLLSWEDEWFRITDLVSPSAKNSITIALFSSSVAQMAGIYGGISLRAVDTNVIRDVAVYPKVETKKISFSCNFWSSKKLSNAHIVFEVAAANKPNKVIKTFTSTDTLDISSSKSRALYDQQQRKEYTFDWPEAHAWTYDNPELYIVRAKLYKGNTLLDQSPDYRFGYREFYQKGNTYYLNGIPTHLRGAQLNLRQGGSIANLLKTIKNLDEAGLNCIELLGPKGRHWYEPGRYRQDAFNKMLDYADKHGMIVIGAMPDARNIKSKIFNSTVARIYKRRIDKYIRLYGNHPSMSLWYMHFNVFGGDPFIYSPSMADGRALKYDPVAEEKKSYMLEAEKIVKSVDTRPIIHHHSGNVGDTYSLNCYIGPTAPLQEREEWPARWAEKKHKAFVAVEHGLFLAPYWFRHRGFPLSKVYNSQSLFEEVGAKFLGRRAYTIMTEEEFKDIYETPRSPWKKVIYFMSAHPVSQEVKGNLVAKYSIRAWRTLGVNGFIFNVIDWDLANKNKQSTKVKQGLKKYCNDTDCYIANGPDDFLLKDHSYFSGETINKQIVLLNDLTENYTDTYHWQLIDSADKIITEGYIKGVAKAGVPTFLPLSFTAPKVHKRSRFLLKLQASGKTEHHDTIGIEVFPVQKKISIKGTIVVFDPVGETKAMLNKAKIKYHNLTDSTDLTQVDLVIVGTKSYSDSFIKLARKTGLEKAVKKGMNLLILEQQGDVSVCGLSLEEQSARRVFVANGEHELLANMGKEDFINMKGTVNLIEPYPNPPANLSHKNFPKRHFKWGNRNITATYVYRKPHFAPFVPILECGFDLVTSPLMEMGVGRGRVVLCQVDVTPRYGKDPVSTTLVNNFLKDLSKRSKNISRPVVSYGNKINKFLNQFGITGKDKTVSPDSCIIVGKNIAKGDEVVIIDAIKNGATALLLPGVKLSGLSLGEKELYGAHVDSDAFLSGISEADFFLKERITTTVVNPKNGWNVLTQPGLVGTKSIGKGNIISCQLDSEPKEWRHLVMTWSKKNNTRQFFIDSKLVKKSKFAYNNPVKNGALYIGSGAGPFKSMTVHSALDEVALWDHALNTKAVLELYKLGKTGKKLSSGNISKPSFYLPLDGHSEAELARGLKGQTKNQTVFKFIDGLIGQACIIEEKGLVYAAKDNFSADEGSCALWISPNFKGSNKKLYCGFWGVENWGMVYKYTNATKVSSAIVKANGKYYYGCEASIVNWGINNKETRQRIKGTRLWNLLLANIKANRKGFNKFLTPKKGEIYIDNELEKIPPYRPW